MRVAYLCDGKACGDICPHPDFCYHTEKIEHAVNFMQCDPDKYIEWENTMDETTTIVEPGHDTNDEEH